PLGPAGEAPRAANEQRIRRTDIEIGRRAAERAALRRLSRVPVLNAEQDLMLGIVVPLRPDATLQSLKRLALEDHLRILLRPGPQRRRPRSGRRICSGDDSRGQNSRKKENGKSPYENPLLHPTHLLQENDVLSRRQI